MPQIVEVPGHGQVEFPDGMSDDQIVAAIQKNLSPPKQSVSDIGGIGQEIRRAFNENLDTIKAAGPSGVDPNNYNSVQQALNVGKAIAAVPGLVASPITGAARSLIGGVFDALSPLTPDQQKQYGLESGRDVADKAMMGVAPRGFSPAGPRTVQTVPTGAELKAASEAAYNDPIVQNMRIDPNGAQTFVAKTQRALLDNKVDPVVAPTVQKVLDNLNSPRFGSSHTVRDFDLARQSLRDVPFNEGRAAGIVRKQIDDYLGNIPSKDLIFGDAAKANELLTDARGNYAAYKRDQQISNALGRAENQTGSTYSGGNINNATRQQLRPILNEKTGVAARKKLFPDYTPAEIDQIKRAVNGTTTGNVTRLLEKELKKIPLPFVGRALGFPMRAIADASTRNQAGLLGEMLRSRSPLFDSLAPVKMPAPNPLLGIPMSGVSLSDLLALLGARGPLVPSYADQEQR